MSNQTDTEIIASLRQTIPACNLDVFAVEAADLIYWLKHKPELRQAFTDMFWSRVQVMQTRDVSKAPPSLIRVDGEDADGYLARCYKVGGYKTV